MKDCACNVYRQGATAMSEFLTTTSRNKNKHMILFVMATNIPTAFDTAVIRRYKDTRSAVVCLRI